MTGSTDPAPYHKLANPGDEAANLRAEYAAIASHQSAVVGIRFQTLGLFLVAVGFLAGHEHPSIAALLVAITVSFWIVERKSRVILRLLGNCGRSMEDGLGFEGVFRSQDRTGTAWSILGWRERLYRHSHGFDVAYLAVLGWSLYVLVFTGH